MLGVIKNGVDDLKETELRLGLPGVNPNIEAAAVKNNNGKRGFSETADLKLNLASKASSVVGSTTTTTADDDESDHVLKKDTINSSVVSSSTDPANPPPKAQVVGWPPVRSFRKNSLAVQKNNSSKEASAAFVKVSVDGAPYLRKVDLKAFNSYQQLSQALTNMFTSSSTFGNLEYVPTYEDKDGDWMLVGDVPWEMFVDSCKRLRMMKGPEAIGLAPRAIEKCKNRS